MINQIYKWKVGSRLKGDPKEIAEVLERIRTKNDGLTPGMVVKEAEKPSSILHNYFDWNNRIAAEKWRLEQAKYIIRSLVILHEGDGDEDDLMVRAFVSINDEEDGKSYTSIAHAMEDEELRKQILAKAKKELQEWAQRYSDLKEFAAVFAAMDDVAI